MSEPMLPITMDQLLGFLRKILEAFKKALAWLGIFVLPEEGEDFPGKETTAVESTTGV